ncbi:MAG TPA: NAD(P)/FAD-dependent oxidoreductase [Casimicrobiaceae bacterium]|nr:NAD(P)/FAD-dependent oxidoreductase [Casimicrobiaceae bacterium]
MSEVIVDVLCAGLGPAGACAAAAAARRGARVLAVDRKREPGLPVQCAEFVPALVGSNVSGLARSVRQSIRAMQTYVEAGAPDLTDPFPGQMLDRAAFDAALVDEAIEAGATCRFATTLRAVGSDGAVTLSDETRIRARVLVGADGPRSVVGRAIGSVNRKLVETRQVTVPLLKAHEATDIFLSAATPGGYAWLFPKGGVANVGAGVDPAHKGALKAIVDDLHASLVAAGRIGREVLMRTGGAIPVGGMLKPTGTLGVTQVLLAGDAAGLANPVTGAGITAAVHAGALAGDAAAEAAGGNPDALSAYEDELDALFAVALSRALRRREELAATIHAATLPREAALRRGWVAYPEYWAP